MKKTLFISIILFSITNYAVEQTFDNFKSLVRDCAKYPIQSLTLSSKMEDEETELSKMSELERSAYLTACEASKSLRDFDPAKIWAYVMRAFEERSFDNEMCGHLSSLFSKEEMERMNLSVMGKANEFLIENRGFDFDSNTAEIKFVWFDRDKDFMRSFDIALPWFWYEGRNFLPQMWEEWYECWKFESNRAKPRERILLALSNEANSYTFHFAPFVYEAIKAGDKTLEKYYKFDFLKKFEEPGSENDGFLARWEKNNDKFVFPKCEGFDSAEKRLEGKKTAFEQEQIDVIKEWCRKSAKYYANPPAKPDYWYYRLDDNYDYDDAEAEEKLYNAFYPPSIPNQKSE